MYAIVEIAGKQYKVEKNTFIYTNRLQNEEGSVVNFDKVLLVDNNGNVKLGTPQVAGASVSAKILKHLKGDKVTIFKKKRRKGYQKSNGFRPYLTKIQIESITA
jgi:large subunit ribosomal protein L21